MERKFTKQETKWLINTKKGFSFSTNQGNTNLNHNDKI